MKPYNLFSTNLIWFVFDNNHGFIKKKLQLRVGSSGDFKRSDKKKKFSPL